MSSFVNCGRGEIGEEIVMIICLMVSKLQVLQQREKSS